MTSESKTVVLGPEWDQALRARLLEVLARVGGDAKERSWVVGGSQEIESLEVSLRGERLLIETETYVGLSITGPETVVDHIVELMGTHRK